MRTSQVYAVSVVFFLIKNRTEVMVLVYFAAPRMCHSGQLLLNPTPARHPQSGTDANISRVISSRSNLFNQTSTFKLVVLVMVNGVTFYGIFE